MNTSLKKLHDLLLAQHAALASKLGEETEPDKGRAILMEMQELLHRIDLVQNLLFRQTSSQLESAVTKVQNADKAFTKALDDVAETADLIKAAGQFLTLVDTALDIAKTLTI